MVGELSSFGKTNFEAFAALLSSLCADSSHMRSLRRSLCAHMFRPKRPPLPSSHAPPTPFPHMRRRSPGWGTYIKVMTRQNEEDAHEAQIAARATEFDKMREAEIKIARVVRGTKK